MVVYGVEDGVLNIVPLVMDIQPTLMLNTHESIIFKVEEHHGIIGSVRSFSEAENRGVDRSSLLIKKVVWHLDDKIQLGVS